MRAANHGALSPDELDRAFRDCWVHAFDVVADRHGFTGAMRAAGARAFTRIEVHGPMHGYGDLDVLPRLGDRRFLVTSGFRRLQESKVRALGVAPLFDEIVIDAVDDAERRGKEGVFADLIARYRIDPAGVLVIGDNADSELAAARRLGLGRVQVLRPGVVPAPDVTARVRGLAELREMLDRRA